MHLPRSISGFVSICLGIAGSLFLVACVDRTDSNEPEITLSYTNHTDRYLEMTILGSVDDTVLGPIRLEPDSMRSVRKGLEFWLTSDYRARITVGREPESCLEFTGPIVDSALDPRSEAAYAQVETYAYTFTDNIVAKASACRPQE